jgi:hypothetical protein
MGHFTPFVGQKISEEKRFSPKMNALNLEK